MQPPSTEPKPEMSAPAPQEGGGGESKGVQTLITGIHSDMLKFKEVLGGVQSVPEQLTSQLDGLIQGYRDFVTALSKVLGGGADAAPQAPAPGGEGPLPVAPKPGPRGMSPGMGGPRGVPAM